MTFALIFCFGGIVQNVYMELELLSFIGSHKILAPNPKVLDRNKECTQHFEVESQTNHNNKTNIVASKVEDLIQHPAYV